MNTFRPWYGLSRLCVAAMLALFIVAFPSASFAKPKRLANGCTIAQNTSIFSDSCSRQQADDLSQKRGYTHQLFCNGDDMQCCTVDNKTAQILNCRKPAGAMVNPKIQDSHASGSVLSRGTDRKELGVETAPPSWLTESWLKEHAGERKSK